MKISKGMYCYDKSNRKAGIGKIIEFLKNNNVLIEYKNNINSVSKGNVVASFNIIDLIEVGDYVNDERVYYAYCSSEGSTGLFIEEAGIRVWLEKNNQINDIVTKEQFDACKYVVERATNE